MERYIVLGGYGMMGQTAVRDLFIYRKNAEIIVAGHDLKKARSFASSFKSPRVKSARVDVTDIREAASLLKGASVVLNAVQYYYNLHVMQACLLAKTNYVDLGGLFHMTKKQLKLSKNFKKAGLIAVLGCGSTPGITNILANYGSRKFDKVEEIHISFADVDYTKYPIPFVIPYSTDTLLDEFMLKPAVFTKSRLKMVAPMSGKQKITFPKPAGFVEGFYTLHSELATLPLSFKSKGLKECSFRVTFPKEFREKIQFLIDAGFASSSPVKLGNISVIPKKITSTILNKLIPPPSTKIRDLEFLRVFMKGKKKGKQKNIVLYTLSSSKWNTSAGNIDTAAPLSIIAQIIAKKEITTTGVYPTEQNIPYKSFFKQLKLRNIKVWTSKR